MNYRTNFNGIGYLANERLAPLEGWPQPEPVAVPELPGSMKFALLYMRRNVDELTGKVVDAMRAMGAEWSLSDLNNLVQLGLMARPPSMHHVLTDAGEREAMKIAIDLAKKYPVHVVNYREGVRNTNMGPWAYCSCGDWSHGRTYRNRHLLRDDAAKHLDKVASGKWKPQKRLTAEELMAAVDAALDSHGANMENILAPDGAVGPLLTAPVYDPDAFDDPDCSIYSDESGDDGNVIDMVEDEAT